MTVEAMSQEDEGETRLKDAISKSFTEESQKCSHIAGLQQSWAPFRATASLTTPDCGCF